MYGYIASHANGTTLVLSDGRVFEQRDTPGGSPEWYLVEEDVEIEAWTEAASSSWDADWTMLQDEDEIRQRFPMAEAARYYFGEPPRNRR